MVIRWHRLTAILIFILFTGCRFTYVVREDGQRLNRIFQSECGKGVFTMRGRGKHSFSFHQSFINVKEIQLDFRELDIKFEGQSLPLLFINERTGKGILTQTWVIREDIEISANFRVEEGVFTGDTLKVYFNNYIGCEKGLNAIQEPLIFHFSRTPDDRDY